MPSEEVNCLPTIPCKFSFQMQHVHNSLLTPREAGVWVSTPSDQLGIMESILLGVKILIPILHRFHPKTDRTVKSIKNPYAILK